MRFEAIHYAINLPGVAALGSLILVLALIAARVWPGSAPARRIKPLGWARLDRQVLLLMLGMGAADGLALALLPVLGLSFGRIEVAWLLITIVRHACFGIVGLGIELHRRRRHSNDHQALSLANWRILAGLQVVILVCELQGLYHEPFRLSTTTLSAGVALNIAGRPLRVLQLSDIHLERTTARERAMLAEVQRIQADIIVLTGDYVNLDYRADPQTWAETRQLLSQLSAPLGVYAVTGTPSVDIPPALKAIFSDLDNITLLQDEIARVALPGGDSLIILGISNLGQRDDQAFLQAAAQIAPAETTLLLHHTPNLAEIAGASGRIDLYLAGHTHGGQVRIPFYGALTTFSRFGKRYEMGEYTLGAMTLYISRGIGMEGMGLPRARFLCPPELVLVEFKAP